MDEIVALLADQRRVVLRAIRPTDARKLHDGFHALSPSSRYQRFMGQLSDLTPPMLRYLTEVDGDDHAAIVALLLDPQEREQELIGVARAIRVERDAAEVAVVVGDPVQRLGLGTLLLERLLDWAAEHDDVRRFVAHALPSNRAIRRLLARCGPLHERADGSLMVLLPAEGEARPGRAA